MLDVTILKAFPDNKINVTGNVLSLGRKQCGKRRHCWSAALLLFPLCFKMLFTQCSLTHYHTMLHFDTLKIYSCGKHCEKRRNCLLQAISPFLIMCSNLYGTSYAPLQRSGGIVLCKCLSVSRPSLSG